MERSRDSAEVAGKACPGVPRPCAAPPAASPALRTPGKGPPTELRNIFLEEKILSRRVLEGKLIAPKLSDLAFPSAHPHTSITPGKLSVWGRGSSPPPTAKFGSFDHFDFPKVNLE